MATEKMAPKRFWIIRPSRLTLALVAKIHIPIQVKNTPSCTIYMWLTHNSGRIKNGWEWSIFRTAIPYSIWARGKIIPWMKRRDAKKKITYVFIIVLYSIITSDSQFGHFFRIAERVVHSLDLCILDDQMIDMCERSSLIDISLQTHTQLLDMYLIYIPYIHPGSH